MGYSQTTTKNIQITVNSQHLPEYSKPNEWFFAYTIHIKNLGNKPVRLRTRHWIITDANGQVQEVQGQGVVGEQPEILPDGHYEYTSFCPLPTNFGTMHGNYRMEDEDGHFFEAIIAPFSLDMPHTIH